MHGKCDLVIHFGRMCIASTWNILCYTYARLTSFYHLRYSASQQTRQCYEPHHMSSSLASTLVACMLTRKRRRRPCSYPILHLCDGMLADCMTLTKRLNATGIFQYIVPTRVYGTHATEVGEPALARARQSGSLQRQQPCVSDPIARIAGQSTLSS